METATFVAIFLSSLLISFTGYALYTAFGQPAKSSEILLKNTKINYLY